MNTIAMRLVSCSNAAGTRRALSYSFNASGKGVSIASTHFVSAAASWRALVTPIAGIICETEEERRHETRRGEHLKSEKRGRRGKRYRRIKFLEPISVSPQL